MSQYPPEVYEYLEHVHQGTYMNQPNWERLQTICLGKGLTELVSSCSYMDEEGALHVEELEPGHYRQVLKDEGELLLLQRPSEVAYWLGNGRVKIGAEAMTVEPQYANVLQALVEMGSASKPELQSKSGRTEPDKLLKKLVAEIPALQPYIRFPGGRGKGGYSTTIIPAPN